MLKNVKEGLLIAAIAVLIALLVGLFSDFIISQSGAVSIMVIVLLAIVVLGILADALGTAAAAATLKPLNALASKKVLGAKEAVSIMKKADRFANISQDVIGDVLNTLSGVFGVGIVVAMAVDKSSESWMTLFITAAIVALNVFGKSIGKSIAIKESYQIMLLCGKAVHYFNKAIGRKS